MSSFRKFVEILVEATVKGQDLLHIEFSQASSQLRRELSISVS